MGSIMTNLKLALDLIYGRASTIAVMLQHIFQLVLCKLKSFRKILSQYEIEIHDDGIEVTRVKEVLSPDQDV